MKTLFHDVEYTMDLAQLPEQGLGTRLLAALVSFAGLAAIAALATVLAMLLVLSLSERKLTTTLSRSSGQAIRSMLFLLILGVLSPPILLVVGVPAVYCLAVAAFCFVCAAAILLLAVISVNGRIKDSRDG
ncbi:MAG: hypothetical protein AAFU85_30090 [Planctomycetota bacterium]